MAKATPETHIRPHHRVYRGLYVKVHGKGPYTCYFCNNVLLTLEIVHHIDEDPWNNEIENLVASHTDCHNKHHHYDVVMSDVSNESRSKSLKKTYATWTEEQWETKRQKTRETWTGRKHRPEVLEKMSRLAKERPKACCLICRREISVHRMNYHQGSKSCYPVTQNSIS